MEAFGSEFRIHYYLHRCRELDNPIRTCATRVLYSLRHQISSAAGAYFYICGPRLTSLLPLLSCSWPCITIAIAETPRMGTIQVPFPTCSHPRTATGTKGGRGILSLVSHTRRKAWMIIEQPTNGSGHRAETCISTEKSPSFPSSSFRA